jgi:hypothetical protein
MAFVLFAGLCVPLRAQAGAQMPSLPKDKTVIEMTAGELLRYYGSDLRHLEFSPNQDELDSHLARIGERVQAFFRDFSDTSSKEYVLLQKLRYDGTIDHLDNREFSYLIIYHPSETAPFLEEYRTDKKNNAVDQDAMRGFFITSGYACISLNFHPAYQQTSRFRYLGRQASDSRTYVIAFAQKLEKGGLRIVFTDIDSRTIVRLPVQGIAWVDQETYQIRRLRVNLLAAGNQSSLKEQSTDIRFSDTRFENASKRLWLPQEVIVTTTIAGGVFRNYHRYSDYRLFAVASDYKIDKPKPRD